MTAELHALKDQIAQWANEAGFQQVGITDIHIDEHAQHLQQWLSQHYHGEMEYMQRHYALRAQPEQLQPEVLRCISFRMDYYPEAKPAEEQLLASDKAYISRYALGRDYHKLIRKKLAQIADQIQSYAEKELSQRAFVDSAPVLERGFAEKAGLGWIGKNTMLINSKAGSYFFLGEILTNLPLPLDTPQEQTHCGSCTQCLDLCPTDAFVGPNQLDARRCISYLTIELKGAIPEDLRPLMGNRVFGCDDCQIVCPWNKFTRQTTIDDFSPRASLDEQSLLALFNWSEAEFLKNTEGSAIRRIGYQRWLRNLAVGLGNAPFEQNILRALQDKLQQHGDLVDEHIHWAITKQESKAPPN